MNKIIFLVVSCLLLSLPIISCCESADFPYASHVSLTSPIQYSIQADIQGDSDPTSVDIHVQAGESVILSIPSSPTTGYSWHLHKASGSLSDIASSIELASCEYKGRSRDNDQFHTAGGSGNEMWSFVVKADSVIGAKSEIPLIYNRVWMPQPAQPQLTINIITAAVSTNPADLYAPHITTPVVEPKPEEPKQKDTVHPIVHPTPIVEPVHPIVHPTPIHPIVVPEHHPVVEPIEPIFQEDSSSSTPEEHTPSISVDIDIDIEARRRRM